MDNVQSPDINIIDINIELRHNSYDIICDAERIPPKKHT